MKEFNVQEASLLNVIVSAHHPAQEDLSSGDVLCSCGRVWLTRVPGSEETGCRQVRKLRKVLNAAKNASGD